MRGSLRGEAEEAAYREYFESIIANLEVGFHDFDIYGHLD